jgi:hypothetical protein
MAQTNGMRAKRRRTIMRVTRREILLLGLLLTAMAASADERSDYYARLAARDVAKFQSLDRNHDGLLQRDEVKGDLDLQPRFDDIDIDRNGTVTPEELQRYIAAHYGVRTTVATAAPSK